ncbi:MAG: RecQ family ATP-dependent DNA helicase [Bacteroidia bacterium]
MEISNILKKYWGYDTFRPFQEEIIQSVLKGKDTLALLPTGGGKSICYQLPAMAMEGLCIVVSPLISLMQDQVEQLQKKGIKAMAITSAMNYREIDITFTNAIHHNYKFLYISPERIQTQLFLRKLPALKVNLIAVDEAHCISQWGYDFRPAYLSIKKIRELKPDIPMLALTATATQKTAEDICKQLDFRNHVTFKTSFARKNLHYQIRKDENKLQTLLNFCNKTKGTGIVFVRNRRKTKEIADFLNYNNIKSDFYHGGLEIAERLKKQSDWINNRKRVIVSTNAFGMGIDKPDVRFVAHLDLPDSLEAWFQEAGRGGRDGNIAYELTLYHQSDIVNLQNQLEKAFPSIEQIKQTYAAICNYYQIAVGAGEGLSVIFNLDEISAKYNIPSLVIYNAVKFLEKGYYLSYTDALYQPTKVHMTINKSELYNFQVQNPTLDVFIKVLLRNYAGLFEEYKVINEYKISQAIKSDITYVKRTLEKLHKLEIIDYIAQTNLPKIIFTQARIDIAFLSILKENYTKIKKQAEQRVQAVIDFVSDTHICRSRKVLQYFNETSFEDCGTCDVCLNKSKQNKSEIFVQIKQQLLNLLEHKNYELNELVSLLYRYTKQDVVDCINQLIDDSQININQNKLVSKR